MDEDDKYLVAIGDGEHEEIIAYNEMMHIIDSRTDPDSEENDLWFFDAIVDHRLGSDGKINVLVKWSNGEETWEPLAGMAKDNPITCALYAKDNGLLETPGWKRFKPYAKQECKYIHMFHQVLAAKKKNAQQFKFGIRVPRSYKEALKFDKENGNHLWEDAIKKELGQIMEYETFKDAKGTIPSGYKKIFVHLVFDVKYDLRRKACLVASGNLTPPTTDNAYSGITSLHSI